MNTCFTENLKWYVIYTLPNYEKKVNSSLMRHEITSFLPLQQVERQWSDRRKIVEVPLFPNYIFVKTPEKERFKILDILGVKKYITLSGRPVLVDDQEINNIRNLIKAPSLEVDQCLVKGDVVRICQGPFHGMQGILHERKGLTRLSVRIESINQVLSIDVCTSWIVAC